MAKISLIFVMFGSQLPIAGALACTAQPPQFHPSRSNAELIVAGRVASTQTNGIELAWTVRTERAVKGSSPLPVYIIKSWKSDGRGMCAPTSDPISNGQRVIVYFERRGAVLTPVEWMDIREAAVQDNRIAEAFPAAVKEGQRKKDEVSSV